jgi:sugar lactone lactonase YvrE
MPRSRFIERWYDLLIGAMVLVSCAPVYRGQMDTSYSGAILWPGAPEKPRVRYLWSLHNLAAEGGKERDLLDVVSGRTREDVSDPQTSYTLQRPQGIYVDERRYYIADPGAARVTVVDRETMDVLQITEAGGESLQYPISVVSGPDGRIYVSDPDMGKVLIYSKDGKYLSSFEGEIERPTGMAIDKQRGIVYVVNTLGHNVCKYSLDGKRTGCFGRRGEGDGEFNFPSYAFVDEKGSVYITDFLNFRIQIFSPEGRFEGKIGILGDSYDSLDKPKGVAVDREGHIYIVDAGRDMVKIFSRDGRLLLFFGETGHKYGDFYLPTGLFIDDKDVVYVADTVNARIQAFQFLGGD